MGEKESAVVFSYLAPNAMVNDTEPSLNVPLLVGLVSGFGTLFLGLMCGILWFAIMGRRRIKLGGSGNPGDYDDEQAWLQAEEEALENMDELSRQYYTLAKAFIAANPPNSGSTDISLSQYLTIQEKGVSAWEFEVDFPNANCFVESRTEIEFFDSTCCSQTNLPVPRQNEVYYWEAKMYDKPVSTLVSVGLSTKPYPTFRLPGYHRYSVAYDSDGCKRINQPFTVPQFGPPLQQGDVVGVGYRPRTGTVFFTRNGRKLEDALHGMRLNLFPTVGATGPCKVSVNFGQAGFVYIEANVKKWGLAPAHGSLAPPPPYGAEQDFLLLESGSSHQNQSQPMHTSACSSVSISQHPPLSTQTSNTPTLTNTPTTTTMNSEHNNNDNHINNNNAHYFFQSSNSPPPFHRSFSGDDNILLPGGPNQVNINMSSLASSANTNRQATTSELPAKYTRHATSSQALLVHTPPPSYTSETESISSLEDEEEEEVEDHDVNEETELLATHNDPTDNDEEEEESEPASSESQASGSGNSEIDSV